MIDQPIEILEKLKEYAKCRKGFLLLSGTNGTGKTYAALAIYNISTPYKLPAKDDDLAIFITQGNLNIVYGNEETNKMKLLEKLCKTKLLIIDDFGSRIPTEAFGEFMFTLIDNRWVERSEVGTIITTNLNSTEVEKNFGTRTLSRIGSGMNLIFLGKDRRLNGA